LPCPELGKKSTDASATVRESRLASENELSVRMEKHFSSATPTKHMKRAEAKILENRKEIPASEPDQNSDTWLLEAKLEEDILDWESVRLDFHSSEIEAEIVESSLAEPDRFTIRTRGKSPLTKGYVIHVDVRPQGDN
jgi:hypothetical protein